MMNENIFEEAMAKTVDKAVKKATASLARRKEDARDI